MDIVEGEMYVVRLWRWDVERIRLDAERDHRERAAQGDANPKYSISVFAAQSLPDESRDSAVERVIGYAKANRSAKWAGVSTARHLAEIGFEMELNAPPDHHYDVILRDISDIDGMSRLQDAFDGDKRRIA